jgi:hypothetical protein
MQSISLDVLKAQMPQAFVEKPSPRVSAKYTFIPTHKILSDLDQLGWKIRSVQNPRYKSAGNQLHGKHLVRLFNPNLHISDGGDVNYVEILLFNSSNGTSAFRLEVGIFRLVCSNGLVIKSEDFGTIKLRHQGYSFDSLKEAVDEMVGRLPSVVTKINTFSQRIMSSQEIRKFAEDAISLRNSGRQATQEELDAILQAQRDEDEGNSLWAVFNRVQEALINGGRLLVDRRGRQRTSKPIRNLDKNLKINQGLWQLAEAIA